MIAKDLAELLMENPEAEVFYEREELYNGGVKTSIFLYKDVFKGLDRHNNHYIEFSHNNF